MRHNVSDMFKYKTITGVLCIIGARRMVGPSLRQSNEDANNVGINDAY